MCINLHPPKIRNIQANLANSQICQATHLPPQHLVAAANLDPHPLPPVEQLMFVIKNLDVWLLVVDKMYKKVNLLHILSTFHGPCSKFLQIPVSWHLRSLINRRTSTIGKEQLEHGCCRKISRIWVISVSASKGCSMYLSQSNSRFLWMISISRWQCKPYN